MPFLTKTLPWATPNWLMGIVFGAFFAVAAPPVSAAPGFALKDINGKTVTLNDYRGKVVYLDFWASWCRPCLKSFPWMRRMQTKYGKKGLVILAVNLDEERALATTFLAQNRSNFTVLFDPEAKVAAKYNVTAMPSSYLIDRKGKIKKVHHGFLEKTAKNKEQEIAELLN